jgi:hypothetical protein
MQYFFIIKLDGINDLVLRSRCDLPFFNQVKEIGFDLLFADLLWLFLRIVPNQKCEVGNRKP